MKKNKIFISAYSKLPKGISATELYTKTAMAIIIDRNTGKIYDVECTLATEVAKRYIKNILTNKNTFSKKSTASSILLNFSRQLFLI